MKKCLTVLLVIAVMFTFSFGSAFAMTGSEAKADLYEEMYAQENTLRTGVKERVLNSYDYNDDGFADYYYSRTAISYVIDDLVDEFVEKVSTKIEKINDSDADITPDYTIIYNLVDEYNATNLLIKIKDAKDSNGQSLLNYYAAPNMKTFVEGKIDAAEANMDQYSEENQEKVAAAIETVREAIATADAAENPTLKLKGYHDAYFTRDNGFKDVLEDIPTLEDEDYAGVDKEVAIAAAIADFEKYGLNTVYNYFNLTADQAVPNDYKSAGTLDEIYEEGTGNKVTIFGVEIANKNKVTTAEATAVNRALRAAILDASDVVTAYANTFNTSSAAVNAVHALYDWNGTTGNVNQYMRSLNNAIKAVSVYEDVVALGEDYKAEEVYGVKTYNDEKVDEAVAEAEALVYGDLASGFYTDPEDYIEEAANKIYENERGLDNLKEENFEIQRFESAIKDAIEKMYSNITTWTPAKKVTYGTDKTPEADYVYLLETYANDSVTQKDWEDIAKQAVADLQDAESYDEIDSILAAAADDFSALTLRSEQKAVEAAKDEYEDALKAYQKVQEALLGTSDYPSGAYDDVVAEGVKLINEATTVVGVEAAYEDAKDLFNTMLKTRTEVKDMDTAIEEAIRNLDVTNLTAADKDAVMDIYEEYLAYVQTPGVNANDVIGKTKLENAVKDVLDLAADALQDEIDAMVKSLDKVDAISDASMESYIALKADVEALIADAKAFTDEVKAINDVKDDTGFGIVSASVNDSKLEATIGATGSGFWTREVTLVESALVQAAKDGASVAEMQAALDAFEALTDRQQYDIDSHALQMVSVINDRVVASVESIKITASSSATKGAMTIKWKVTGDTAGVDAFEIWRSTKKSSGFQKFFTTTDGTKRTYKNTKSLKAGTRYYYKVRGIAYDINGTKIYSDWSNKAYRIAK